jgi:hypothetical protein
MQGLVKGFVGGAAQSFSNFTGSLYTIIKKGTGQQDLRNFKKAKNIAVGIKEGVWGLGSEIISGVVCFFY